MSQFIRTDKIHQALCESLGLDASKVEEVDIKITFEGVSVMVKELPKFGAFVEAFKAIEWKKEDPPGQAVGIDSQSPGGDPHHAEALSGE